MEGRKNSNQMGLPPPPWTTRRPATVMRPLMMKPPLSAPGSFQGWQQPFFLSHGSATAPSGSGTKPPLNGETIDLFSSEDEEDDNEATGMDRNQESSDPSATETMRNGRHGRFGRNLDPNIDPKRLRRIISNRVSAQKSRLKKLQHVNEMEKKVQALEAQITVLSPQVALYRNQQQILQLEYNRLREEISARTSSKILKDAEIEENRAELRRLKQLYFTQQNQRMQLGQTVVSPTAWDHELEQMLNPNSVEAGSDQGVHMRYNNQVTGETMDKLKQQQQQAVEKMRGLGKNMNNSSQNGSPNPQENLDFNPNLDGIERILEFSLKPINQQSP